MNIASDDSPTQRSLLYPDIDVYWDWVYIIRKAFWSSFKVRHKVSSVVKVRFNDLMTLWLCQLVTALQCYLQFTSHPNKCQHANLTQHRYKNTHGASYRTSSIMCPFLMAHWEWWISAPSNLMHWGGVPIPGTPHWPDYSSCSCEEREKKNWIKRRGGESEGEISQCAGGGLLSVAWPGAGITISWELSIKLG